VPGEQLPLSMARVATRRLPARIVPMQPTSVGAPFDDPEYWFEPWWPGVRAQAFVEGGRLRLSAEGLNDALAALPELADLPSQLDADGVVLDGTLLVLDADGRPDAELLRRRLAEGHGPGGAAFVASDLLFVDGAPLGRRTYRARRAQLEEVLRSGERVAVGRGHVAEGLLMAEALHELGVVELSARRLAARYRGGPGGESWLRAPTTLPGAEPLRDRRPSLALIMRLPLD
jgi:bifunctional non-homologous end joining protein LigD